MQGSLPPAAQEKYEEIEALQDEAEAIVAEQRSVEQQLDDLRDGLDALTAADDDVTVYQRIGNVHAERTASELTPELESTVNDLEARLADLEETEADIRRQFENRKEDIKHLLGGAGGMGE